MKRITIRKIDVKSLIKPLLLIAVVLEIAQGLFIRLLAAPISTSSVVQYSVSTQPSSIVKTIGLTGSIMLISIFNYLIIVAGILLIVLLFNLLSKKLGGVKFYIHEDHHEANSTD